MRHDAASLSRMLAGRIQQLVTELFPAGRREGSEWRVGSLAGEAGQSLAVHLHGAKAGLWGDFSAGLSGDALDLVAEALYRGRKGEAMAWARRWLGLGDEDAPAADRLPPPAPINNSADDGKRTAFALRTFLTAQPSIAGTAAAQYLAGRGIDLSELRRQPKALRFHPALDNRERERALPAMVAAISGADGSFQAVHRTWLEYRDGAWRKALLLRPKMVLGKMAGGSIRLWRGASGKPLAQAPAGDRLVVAEGIETALSVALACPDRRIIAAVSIGNMVNLVLPPAISSITICADNDAPGSPAARALQAAIDRFTGEGRQVLIARSPVGSDFNDLLARGAI